MLNTKSEIAVRLYDNKTYGTTYGKGLYRKAIYNGTIDAKVEGAKYLIDLYSYEDWKNMAKTDEQMEILANIVPESDTLYSWLKHYDPRTKEKSNAHGVFYINIQTMEVAVLILDEAHDLVDTWNLSANRCKIAS